VKHYIFICIFHTSHMLIARASIFLSFNLLFSAWSHFFIKFVFCRCWIWQIFMSSSCSVDDDPTIFFPLVTVDVLVLSAPLDPELFRLSQNEHNRVENTGCLCLWFCSYWSSILYFIKCLHTTPEALFHSIPCWKMIKWHLILKVFIWSLCDF